MKAEYDDVYHNQINKWISSVSRPSQKRTEIVLLLYETVHPYLMTLTLIHPTDPLYLVLQLHAIPLQLLVHLPQPIILALPFTSEIVLSRFQQQP
jgi:hypothetical protein